MAASILASRSPAAAAAAAQQPVLQVTLPTARGPSSIPVVAYPSSGGSISPGIGTSLTPAGGKPLPGSPHPLGISGMSGSSLFVPAPNPQPPWSGGSFGAGCGA